MASYKRTGCRLTIVILLIACLTIIAVSSFQPTIVKAQYSNTLTMHTTGNGVVIKSPDLESYPLEDPVTLTANADAGWRFNSWSGDISGSTNPITVNVVGHMDATATFVQITWPITVTQSLHGTISPATASYAQGTNPTETITPDTGYNIASITVDGASVLVNTPSGQSVSFNNIQAAHSVTATFAPISWAITVTQSPNGAISPATASYAQGTSITETITPNTGYYIASITVDGASVPISSPSGQIVSFNNVQTAHTVTANFAPMYTLTVNTVGSGSVTKTPNNTSYPSGTSVQLTASASSGWAFSGWSGAVTGSTNPVSLTMDSAKTVAANFVQVYTLTVNTNGTGTVTKNPDQPTYSSGSTVELTANPANGWSFTGWSGDATGSVSPISLTMDSNKILTATFARKTYVLSTNVAGSGSINRSPNQTSYASDSNVQLTAAAAIGWTFSGWSGAVTGSANPIVLTMDSAKAVTATFTPNDYTLSTNLVGSGSVTLNPNKASYHYGDTVILTASPSSGWSFSSWSNAFKSSQNPITIIINGSTSVTATFTQTNYQVVFAQTSNGTTTPTGTQTYLEGQYVPITANPAAGYIFSYWTSSSVSAVTFDNSNSASAMATIKGNATITAIFAVKPSSTPSPSPTTSASPTSTASTSPSPTQTVEPTSSSTTTPTNNPTSGPSQSTPSPNNPSSTPKPSVTPVPRSLTILALTSTGANANLTLTGDIVDSSISSATITTNDANTTTTVALAVVGQNIVNGLETVTIPKSAIPCGTIPTVYINNDQPLDQGYTQDANNYNIWFKTAYSTYELTIAFQTTTAAAGFPLWAIIAIIAIVIASVLVVVLQRTLRNKNFKLPRFNFLQEEMYQPSW